MSKKIKRKDGTVEVVANDYTPAEGETFAVDVTDMPTFDHKAVTVEGLRTIGAEIKRQLDAFRQETAKTLTDSDGAKEQAERLQTLIKKVEDLPINAPTFMQDSAQATAEANFSVQQREKISQKILGGPYFNFHIQRGETQSDGNPINKFTMGVDFLRRGDRVKAAAYLALPVEQYKKEMSDLMGTDVYAQTVGTDAEGGYLAPPSYELMVLMNLGKYGLFKRFVPVQISDMHVFNLTALDSAITGYWVGEAAEITNSSFTLSRPSHSPGKLAALVRGSREFWEDAVGGRSVLDQIVAEVFDYHLDNQWLNGSGSPFTGVLTVTGGQDEVIGGTTVVGGVTLLRDDIVNCEGLVLNYNRPGLMWVVKNTVVTEMRKIVDNDGRPYFETVPGKDVLLQNPDVIVPSMVGRYPMFESAVMPGTSPGANTAFAALFNPAEVSRAKARAGIYVDEFKSGTDQDGVNLITKDSQAVRFIYRISIFNHVKEDIDGSQNAVARLKTSAA